MGRLSRKLKRAVKKVAKNVERAVSAPVRVAGTAIKGGSLTEISKEVGRGVGAVTQLSPFTAVIQSTTGQKVLSSNTLNKVTLGTTKEFRNVGQGFNQMGAKQNVSSSFYKSGISLGVKAAAVGATSAYLASSSGKAAVAGAKAKATAFKVKTAAAWAKTSTSTKLIAGAAIASGNLKKAGEKLGIPEDFVKNLPDGSSSDGYSGGSERSPSSETVYAENSSPLVPMVAAASILFFILKK